MNKVFIYIEVVVITFFMYVIWLGMHIGHADIYGKYVAVERIHDYSHVSIWFGILIVVIMLIYRLLNVKGN